MKVDFFVPLMYQRSTVIRWYTLNILCVTYFVSSITMPDLQSNDMRQIRQMMSASPVAPA